MSNSCPVMVPPTMGKSALGPLRRLAFVFAVDLIRAGVGVSVGTKMRPLLLLVAVGVSETLIVAVAVIAPGLGSEAISASVATGRFAGAFSTKKLAIQPPLSSKYQLLLSSLATTLTRVPAGTWPAVGKEMSGPVRRLDVTGTVLPISATVGVSVAVKVGVGVCVAVAVAVADGAVVAVAVAVAVASLVGVSVAVAVSVAVGVGGRIGLSGLTLTVTVSGDPNVSETGNVTSGLFVNMMVMEDGTVDVKVCETLNPNVRSNVTVIVLANGVAAPSLSFVGTVNETGSCWRTTMCKGWGRGVASAVGVPI